LNKKEALKIVFNCAKLYKENLEGRNLLFLSVYNKTKFNYIEVRFLKSNYQHLTGVVVNEENISPSYFYEKCLNKRLSINEFEFKSDGTTPLKLSVLEQLMNIYKNSKMIGDFNSTKPVLYSDKLTGDTFACMGFRKDNQFYVPVTVLKEDTRDLINNQERIIAIFSKNINEELYKNLNYLVKGFNDKDKLPSEVLSKLNIENMICKFENCFVKSHI
jgi:hypothetical protein